MNYERMIATRRSLLTGLASAGGLLWTGCSESEPPTYGNLLRMGDALTYKAQRLLLPAQALAREYERRDVSSIPAIGNTNPGDSRQATFNAARGPLYDQLRSGSFTHWRLSIEGSVARPGLYSLADLHRFPSRTQITKHTCEEGWSAIAEWTGVQLRRVLEAAGMLPAARYVNFHAFDDTVDSIDMRDALHPQTLL